MDRNVDLYGYEQLHFCSGTAKINRNVDFSAAVGQKYTVTLTSMLMKYLISQRHGRMERNADFRSEYPSLTPTPRSAAGCVR